MKKVTNKTGVRNISLFDQDYVQDAYSEAIKGVLGALNPYSYPVILWGCQVVKDSISYEVSEGAIAYQGEVYLVAHKIINSSADAYFYLKQTSQTVAYQIGGLKETYVDSVFELAITLTGATSICKWNEIRRVEWVQFNKLHSIGDIMMSMIDSSDFDTGLGKTYSKYEGWAWCNGSNGTVDMGGFFPVGQKAGGDYDTLGGTGGLEEVELTVEQLPSHNHGDSAGSDVAAVSRQDGRNTYTGDLGLDNSFGSNEPNLRSFDFLAPVGGSESHENRPPFKVLRFIQKVA